MSENNEVEFAKYSLMADEIPIFDTSVSRILENGHGGWNRIDKFFKENKEIQPYLEEVTSKLLADGCYSMPIIYVQTIEKLLETLNERE